MDFKTIKKQLLARLNEQLDQNMVSAQQSIDSAKESRDSDTKSSAGDKYETGRSMMQFELEKNEVQLNKALHLKNELLKIDHQKVSLKAEFGSIVLTDQGNYFLAIGIGKVMLDGKCYYAISLVSPLGQLLNGKQNGDSFLFNGNDIKIVEVY